MYTLSADYVCVSVSADFAGAGVGRDFRAITFGHFCRRRCRLRLPRRHFWLFLRVPESVVTSAPSLSVNFAGAGVVRDFCAVNFGRFCGCRCRLRLPRCHFRPILQVPVSVETSAPSLLADFAGFGVGCDFCAVIFGQKCGHSD